MGMMVLLVLMAMQAGLSDKPPVSPPAILSVCDVVARDPTRLNGNVIKATGLLVATDEGVWLTEKCKSHLVTKGLAWGSDLSVHVDTSDENISRAWESFWKN
jgi:hypothetical protein